MTNELVASTTDGGDLQTAEETVTAGSPRLDAGGVRAVVDGIPSVDAGAGVPLPEAPAPDPFTQDEYDAIVHAIFDGLDSDPWRVGDLLADALGFLGGQALEAGQYNPASYAQRAAGLLRRMEQRALWGPDQPRPEVQP